MAFVKLELPQGVYNHGTDYEAVGRWNKSNLIRWQDKSLRPVGGWTTRAENITTAPPRGAHAWINNAYNPLYAVGTYNKLYALNASSTVTDITPVGLTAGRIDAEENLGYGGNFYGAGYYGVERPSSGVFQEATTWSLDNWGEYLVACSPDDGKLYEWDFSGVATQIANSPIDCDGLLITDERFIFAFAAGGNPRKVQWCNREDNTDWTPAATNEAGDIELQTSGQIVCGVRMRGRVLILTTHDAHVATYAGPPTVYGFERVGTSCGAVSRKSLVSVGEGAFWMSKENFFVFNGSSVQTLVCEVSDYVFKNMNISQISKTYAVHNGQYNEVWWFYPSSGSLENDSYVMYDYTQNIWAVGSISRTAGFDSGALTTPIWFDADGNAYNHEQGHNFGDSVAFVESGPINIGAGDNVMHVTQIIPDEATQGEAKIKLKSRFYPNSTEREYGPYPLSSPTSVRVTGRQVRVRIEGEALKDWRAGIMRLDVSQGGKR
jgi:hypothetical protein